MSMRSLSRLLILISILSFLASVSETKPANRGARKVVDQAHAQASNNGKTVKKLRQFDIRKAAARKRADGNNGNCNKQPCPSRPLMVDLGPLATAIAALTGITPLSGPLDNIGGLPDVPTVGSISGSSSGSGDNFNEVASLAAQGTGLTSTQTPGVGAVASADPFKFTFGAPTRVNVPAANNDIISRQVDPAASKAARSLNGILKGDPIDAEADVVQSAD